MKVNRPKSLVLPRAKTTQSAKVLTQQKYNDWRLPTTSLQSCEPQDRSMETTASPPDNYTMFWCGPAMVDRRIPT
jgi:hypothetical protein